MPQFVAAIPAIFSAVGSAASSAAAAIGGAASSIGSALGIGGTAAGAAGAAAGGGLSLGSLATGILGGVSTAFSTLASLRAGRQQADSLNAQGRDALTEMGQEEILGQRREVGLKNELAAKIGSISTAYAASGIDLSYGSGEITAEAAGRKFDQEITLDRATTDMRKARLAQRAGSYFGMAREARASSVLQAAGTAAGGLLKIAQRG